MSSHNSPISPDYHPPDRVGEREGEEEGKNSLWMIRGFRESLINSGGSYFVIEGKDGICWNLCSGCGSPGDSTCPAGRK